MQNKKTLLIRLLGIYITLFIVLAASIVHNLMGDFSRGMDEGYHIGENIAKSWMEGKPRKIFMLSNIPIENDHEALNPKVFQCDSRRLHTQIASVNLLVDEQVDNKSQIASIFSAIGGNIWFFLLAMGCMVFYLAIVVLMFMIIHSLRKSIREERTLDKHNVWYLRVIGLLIIAAEITESFIQWCMSRKAAEMLAGAGMTVDTDFHISTMMIIMSLLILFAAEVFAIGQRLSEEQKLTI